MLRIKITLLTISFFAINVLSFAQRVTTSPYSMFGYGDVYTNSLHVSKGKGGSGIANRNKNHISFLNPAGHSGVQSERFIFETGIGNNMRMLQQEQSSNLTNAAGLEYLAFAFPIFASKWSSAIGLLPFSSVGYEITASNASNDFLYEGSGGINQIVWGNAFTPFSNFSIGFHARFLFGESYTKSFVLFPESSASFSTEKRETIKTNGLIWDFGFIYTIPLSETSNISIAATYRDKQTAAYTQKNFLATFLNLEDSEEPITFIDTVSNSYNSDIRTDFPQKIGVGIQYTITNKFEYSLDVSQENWNKIFVYGTTNKNLSNSISFNTGIEYIPNTRSLSYFKRLPYRIGFHYSQLPISETIGTKKNKPIDVGVSFGTDFMLKQTGNNITLSFILGKRGDFTVSHSIQETYFITKCNIRLHEAWFFKRKID